MFSPFRSRFVAPAVALVLFGIVAAVPAADDKLVEPGKKAKESLGVSGIKILEGSTKVECFRIKSEITTKVGKEFICGYEILAKGKDQGKEFEVRLANVLFTDKTYLGESARCFEPGVVFRVWHEKEWIDVVICFTCTNLAVFDAKGKEINEAHCGFGGSASEALLIKLAKDAFPDDKDIQALIEKKK